MIHLRPAQAADQKTIERIIVESGINRMSLDWRRFIVAYGDDGAVSNDGAYGAAAEWPDPGSPSRPAHDAGQEPAISGATSARIVGIGQVKQHGDGSRELASIAVIPERRGQGVAGEIIRTLLAQETGVLYLTCRDELEGFYARFGFHTIGRDEMPPYFRRISRLAGIFIRLVRPGVRLLVMRREAQ